MKMFLRNKSPITQNIESAFSEAAAKISTDNTRRHFIDALLAPAATVSQI